MVFAMVWSIAPPVAFAANNDNIVAYPVEGGNIYFDTSTGTVTNCDWDVTSAVIPEQIQGVRVIAIGGWAFDNAAYLSSIRLPDSVTSIGNSAFQNCTGLSNISIPNNVISIGDGAFTGCNNLKEISIPKCNFGRIFGATNSPYGYWENSGAIPESLKTVTLLESWDVIGSYMFNGCSAIEKIYIPNTTKNIGVAAFSGCSGLSEIDIPDSVQIIGYHAFGGCSGLKKIIIPDSVTEIDNGAFADCSALSEITIPLINDRLCYLFSNSYSSGILPESLKKVTVSEKCTFIGESAFENCEYIEDVEIKAKITSISKDTFRSCRSLRTVNISNSVTSIGDSAFVGCTSLNSISIPNSVTSIENDAFFNCTNLRTIHMPNSVTSIGGWAFYGCTNLTDVYYGGSNTDWRKISVEYGNEPYLTNAKIHFTSEKIAQNVPSSKYGILVVNSEGKAISGAKVQWNNSTQTTSDDGTVFFDKLTVGQPSIKVTCDGYEPYSNSGINYEKNERGYDIIRLYKTGDEAGYKLKSAIYTAGIGQCDVLNGTKRLSTSNSKDSFTLRCKADGADIAGYMLLQNNTLLKTSADGEFTLQVGELSVGAGVEVAVISANGKSVRTPINLELVKDQAQEHFSFKLGGEKAVFTVPSDFPFIGDSELTIDMPEIPEELIDLYVDEDAVHLGINCKLKGEDKNAWDENIKEAKSLLARLKQVRKNDIGNSLQAKINYMMKNKNKEASVGPLKVKCNFIGYGEGKLDKNGSANIKVYLCLTLSGSKTIQGPTTVVVCVPVTYSVKVSGEGKLIGEGTWELGTGTLSGDITATITPGLEAFGGVGIGKFTGAGAYGNAELPIEIQLLGTTNTTGVNSIDLNGELGLKIYLGALEYKKAFAYHTWHLYTRTQKPKSSVRTYSGDIFDRAAMFDADAYQTADISYLAGESDWLGEQTAQAYAVFSVDRAAVSGNELQTLQIDTYRNMQPLLPLTMSHTKYLRSDS